MKPLSKTDFERELNSLHAHEMVLDGKRAYKYGTNLRKKEPNVFEKLYLERLSR
jgi:hypothetical protein